MNDLNDKLYLNLHFFYSLVSVLLLHFRILLEAGFVAVFVYNKIYLVYACLLLTLMEYQMLFLLTLIFNTAINI
jgi:hypothetical protein